MERPTVSATPDQTERDVFRTEQDGELVPFGELLRRDQDLRAQLLRLADVRGHVVHLDQKPDEAVPLGGRRPDASADPLLRSGHEPAIAEGVVGVDLPAEQLGDEKGPSREGPGTARAGRDYFWACFAFSFLWASPAAYFSYCSLVISKLANI
jgi:hypothetical protein